jgi:hypothetical protein
MAVLAAWAACVSFRPLVENDVFWHLMLGRAVLRAGRRVVPEPTALDALSRPRPVPEWLWDVAVTLLHRVGGWAALSALGLALGVACALSLGWVLRRRRGEGHELAWALVAALTLVCVLPRAHERPESLALCLLPLFVLRSLEGVADRWARLRLVALAALWMQVHATAILAPALYVACRLPAWRTADRRVRRDDALTALGLVAALLTGAHGAGVFSYAAQHAGGDAVLHITDMRPATLGFFDPRTSIQHPVYAALWLLSLLGLVLLQAVPWAELLLALMGLAVAATAARGISVGALLLAPLALRSAEALGSALRPRPVPWRAVALVATALVLARATVLMDRELGALGTLGLRPGEFPTGAARLLRAQAPGARVLTSYVNGAPLGWWLDGRARTFVDSRTPLHFDDTEYAVSRELAADEATMLRAAERYRFDYAVVARDSAQCERLRDSGRWLPVLVEARDTTFAPLGRTGGPRPLRRLLPCGPRYLSPESCGTDGGRSAGEEIEYTARALEPSFRGFLRADRAVRCGAGGVSPQRLLSWVPSEAEAFLYRPARDGLLAQLLVSAGRSGEAADVLEGAIREGQVGALQIVAPSLAQSDPARLRSLLEALLLALDDTAPPLLRRQLAMHCAADGDAACVRFQGLRAAARGAPGAEGPLCWLIAHHPEARVRADARAWLEVLQREAAAQQRPVAGCPGP